jgi:uncharacterized protein YccT (UPF0319 family)
MKVIPAAAVALLLLIFAVTAMADTSTTTFEDFDLGSVNGQHDWTADAKYDQRVVDVLGGKAFRVSNAVTSGSFSDMPYSAPVDPGR